MVLIGSDRSKGDFEKYHKEMPWLALPFEDRYCFMGSIVCVGMARCIWGVHELRDSHTQNVQYGEVSMSTPYCWLTGGVGCQFSVVGVCMCVRYAPSVGWIRRAQKNKELIFNHENGKKSK